ncbi:MAG TPA: BTAD domain-containing putative transcriptional regulator [Gaiellaceae bacterium]|nr:BTAD domain-containing putative transcriptional regulator [Gaiellaceae bacterium]
MLELRILGPLEVVVDGEPVELRRAKQRSLLALLLLSAGEVVSADRLIEELWAGAPPATAKDALQNYVSQLRKALGRDVIATRAPGYVLEVEPDQTDVGRFERLVDEARGAGDAETRAAVLREALDLWRGTPLADLAFESFTGLEVARLEELRAAARADLADAELALGHHAELVPELEATMAERPFDERPRAQLMLALYRAGRQADALEAFQDARRTLADELGLDPGAQLRELEQAILRQDTALDLPLAIPTITEERRKTVTILFADLVESTELAEALDPEALRRVLDGYFAAARRAIESHGGTIEKFIGDAVMAVFGVPVAHEDDALRAVRAAVDTRTAVAALSDAAKREQGLTLDLRIGINTGDVYVGDPGQGAGLVTGNAVNIAKRLEQAAPTGSIMLGAPTLELVRDAVRVKAVKPRGRRDEKPLTAFRLLELFADAPAVARYLEAELVGREEELRWLLDAFGQAKREPPSRVVTVVGEPGIGKTRLANELVALAEAEATVLTGRCVSYGEGATYLPLREMVSVVDLRAALEGAEDAELVAQRVSELTGLAEGTAPAGEGAWAVRRLFEALARERPLLLVFEDVHWAEPTLLDLVEQLAERASGPILALCIARPELLEARPGWAEKGLVLEPLGEGESVALLASLPGGDELAPETLERIVEVAGGNPLFAEQLFAYVSEGGAEALAAVPPSVEALLESRLDLLEADERGLLQRAAVVGREFSHRALTELSSVEETAAISRLVFELVRKGLVRPARAEEEAFRFHHVLVRDVAYSGLPKADRARLHERYADRLGTEPDAPDEIVGYHLEQAYRYRAELGPVDRRAKQIAADAGARLGAAGMRAFRSGDMPATTNLLRRATSLLPTDDSYRRELLCDLALTRHASGDSKGAVDALSEAIARSREAGDRRIESWAAIELAYIQLQREPQKSADDLLEATAAGISIFESVQDHRALGRALVLMGWVHGGRRSNHTVWLDAAERALAHYKVAGWSTATCLGQIGGALCYGPTPVEIAVKRIEHHLARDVCDRAGRAYLLSFRASLAAQQEDFDRARSMLASARTTLNELGLTFAALAYCGEVQASIDLLSGEPAAAATALRVLCDELQRLGASSYLASRASDLAEALLQVGRGDEAYSWTETAEVNAAGDDLNAQMGWPPVRARIHAQRGEFMLADALARQGVLLADRSDDLNRRAKAYAALASVLHDAGNDADAGRALIRATELYKEKGNLAGLARVETLNDPALA